MFPILWSQNGIVWNGYSYVSIGLKLGRCDLENESVKVLTKCLWKSLKKVRLDENEIGDEGADYLGSSDWLELQIINLCKYFVILGET